MSKEEIIAAIEARSVDLGKLRLLLVELKKESLVARQFTHGAMGFLLTAVDYLETNLSEIRNRVRMD